jgi:hypothetical protein
MARITYEQLVKINACPEREKFKERFGEAMELTPDIAEQHACDFDTRMCIMKLLTTEQVKEWGRRMAERVKGMQLKGRVDPEFKKLKARVAAEVYCEAHDGTE